MTTRSTHPTPLTQRLSLRLALGLSVWAATLGTAQASPNVGVSVSIQQPGFFGRVDIGDQSPVLIYPQPVIVQQSPYGARQRPIYMRVPPGHSQNWGRYCGQYSACGQPVYFVRDLPPQRGGYRDRHDRHDHHDRHERYDRHERHDHGERDGRGRGEGHGHGQGRDRD